jgi:hypothetical protein
MSRCHAVDEELMPDMQLTLSLIPGAFAVCRLAPDDPVPAWAFQGMFYSVSRTPDELSVVCAQEYIPAGVLCHSGWRCLGVAGPLDFAMVGVLASLVRPLAQAGISVFALSTYDTDYLLVQDESLAAACQTLRRASHHVVA